MAIKTNRTSSANGKKISKTEIQSVFKNSLADQDAARLQALQGLLRISNKKDSAYAREEQRLITKYGRQNAHVQATQDKRTANQNQIQGLNMEVRRAGTDVPKVNEKTWLGHGHVYDQNGCPIKDAEITLHMLDEQRITQISSIKTNIHGYYKIEYVSNKVGGSTNPAQNTGSDMADDRSGQALNINQTQERINSGLQINRPENADQDKVFIRATLTSNPDICADSTPLTPKLGTVNYRDIILNTNEEAAEKDRRAMRYLGNSSTRELHDLKNEQPACRIDAIRFDHCVNFKDTRKAIQAGYDYCAYCFGKNLSKR